MLAALLLPCRPKTVQEPPSGTSRLASGWQLASGHIPKAPFRLRRRRFTCQVRSNLHYANGSAHARNRHRRQAHPRSSGSERCGLRVPPAGLAHPACFQRRQVRHQLGRIRPVVEDPEEEPGDGDDNADESEAVQLDTEMGTRESHG